MKKTIVSVLVGGLMVTSISVFAESRAETGDDFRLPPVPEVSLVANISEHQENMTTSSLTRIKARGALLIKQRINSLTSNKTTIDANNSLTVDQKTSIGNLITANITGLTALRTTIASSSDATSTKALVSSIFTNFRIYGIVIPQIRLEKRIYDLQNHSLKLSGMFLKVQAKIDEYKGKGKDVTVWQKNLDDAKVKVALDMNTLANALTKVVALKPSDYGTSSAATIEVINKDLKSVSQDFKTFTKSIYKPMLTSKKHMEASTTVQILGNGLISQ